MLACIPVTLIMTISIPEAFQSTGIWFGVAFRVTHACSCVRSVAEIVGSASVLTPGQGRVRETLDRSRAAVVADLR